MELALPRPEDHAAAARGADRSLGEVVHLGRRPIAGEFGAHGEVLEWPEVAEPVARSDRVQLPLRLLERRLVLVRLHLAALQRHAREDVELLRMTTDRDWNERTRGAGREHETDEHERGCRRASPAASTE
jgi:hypothetical protein